MKQEFVWVMNIRARRGSRSVHEVGGGSEHQSITVSVCGSAAGVKLPPFILYSAAGVKLPPFILYRGKHLYNT